MKKSGELRSLLLSSKKQSPENSSANLSVSEEDE